MTGRRVRTGSRQVADRPLTFFFDGVRYPGFVGDTLASALLAAGVRVAARSIRYDRPRGITSAGPEEPTAIVQVDEPFPEPMLAAPMIELQDGLAASTIRGRGRLASGRDPAAYDALHHHCDVAVVGAGPAGLAAALAAGRRGARVLLLDDRPAAGGALVTEAELAWVDEVVTELAALPRVVHRQRTTVAGYYDQNYLVAVERRTDHPGHGLPACATRERVWRIRAGQVILATGAHERTIAFAGNDVPGVMLAESARAYLHRYGVLVGERVVLFTEHDDSYRVADDLRAAGAEVRVVDPRGAAEVIGTEVDDHGALTAVLVRSGPDTRTLPADVLLVSGGWNPAVQLFSHSGGTLRFSPSVGAFVPDVARQRVTVIGAAAGLRTTTEAVASGLASTGGTPIATAPDGLAVQVRAPAGLYAVLGDTDPITLTGHYVDLQRDVTVADIARASGAGLVSVEHVKRYTTAGTAHDQGKTSGIVTSAVLAAISGSAISELGVPSFRPPYTPISFAALAGRERGRLYDPVRTTGAHSWHLAHGAELEPVGQWLRPWYYPRSGEDMAAAVARECAAARTGVAFMDGSTLGKIDVQGPDAGAFLDLLYTNVMSSLKVGSVRYGVMCSVDGMVLDDGTVSRLTTDRFLLTTTTGNAAKVLDWIEEWLQTEWPRLRVTCTSVTEQLATMALVGPHSRALLAALAPSLATGSDDFPFMTWRDTTVGGMRARVSRISFSGELAYEVNVSWDRAAALWQLVWMVGEPVGLTPYGTEAMHVLRAEKGYPIIGQDTDGTVTPQDLGMSWVVSKKKPDYLGRRSHLRPENLRDNRKHLVGLLPQDPSVLLPEGSQLIATDHVPAPPVPMLGHVTSSYASAALSRTFALALLAGGRDRVGSTVYVVVDGAAVPVTVAPPVLYDPDGHRRDGDSNVVEMPLTTSAATEGARVSPLASYADAFGRLSARPGSLVQIAEEPPQTLLNLRASPGSRAADALAGELGLSWPAQTNATSGQPDTQLLGLGPDEVLLVSLEPALELETRLRAALGDDATGVCDVTATRTTVRVSGPAARTVLSHGCALDLDEMAAGSCAQSLLAQCAVILVVDGPEPGHPEDRLRILVRSSFAPHLAEWLLLTAEEYVRA
ncbi:MAG TPA: 2Fe-2S iron-sulfur cluster-binding protein [Propionibacteriaceae bacterium]|nr:2Fe-2S iron-sulfur cluster-binding protein [Propionibacteriaceae bacterium]